MPSRPPPRHPVTSPRPFGLSRPHSTPAPPVQVRVEPLARFDPIPERLLEQFVPRKVHPGTQVRQLGACAPGASALASSARAWSCPWCCCSLLHHAAQRAQQPPFATLACTSVVAAQEKMKFFEKAFDGETAQEVWEAFRTYHGTRRWEGTFPPTFP